ncbi:MAG TPA: phage tail tube protein [Ktedonobacteraceae bacterium]|nr:phage tail tube protein [Ktedonobacteraceae bacterium]
MTAQPGYIAILQIGPTPTTITGIKSVDLKIGTDIIDITALADGQWKKKMGALSDYTISFSGNMDMTDAEQTVLQNAIITTPGTTVAWLVAPLGLGTGKPKYTGSIILKSDTMKFDVKSEQTIAFDGEGTGAIVAGVL